jgi:mRNA interferase HicA
MKRRDLVKYLTDNGCVLIREGGKYSIYQNPANQKEAPITRHPEMISQPGKSASNWACPRFNGGLEL